MKGAGNWATQTPTQLWIWRPFLYSSHLNSQLYIFSYFRQFQHKTSLWNSIKVEPFVDSNKFLFTRTKSLYLI